MEISTSILNASNRREVILKLNESLTDYIHFDVMDGELVENTQFSIEELVELLKVSNKKNDVHLMVKKPLKYIEAIKDLNVEYITIHVEINENISEILDFIKVNNIKCGLAIDLDTDINLIRPYLHKIDLVLIMSVKAGYGGQEFEPKVLTKLNEIPTDVKIELDGGIDNKAISLIKSADIVVSGVYILKNIDKNILELKNANN